MPSPNQSEYKSRVGLKDLYVALVTQDDANGYTAGTPEKFAPAAMASVAPAANKETQYMDDQPFDVMQAEGETEIQLTVSEIPAEMLAYVTGDVFDAATGRVFDRADPTQASEFALGFRSKKSNGSYRYYWFLKGKFTKPSEEHETQGDTPAPKTPQITFTAVKTTYASFDLDGGTTYDGAKRVFGDDDTTNFDATGWFTAVQTPAAGSYSALALSSSVPTDEDTGISVSANITLTFNNALLPAAVNNVKLYDDSFALVATATPTLNTGRTIMTIDPTSDLSASSDYHVLISGVTDIYGQTLTTQVDFTTA